MPLSNLLQVAGVINDAAATTDDLPITSHKFQERYIVGHMSSRRAGVAEESDIQQVPGTTPLKLKNTK